MKYIITESKLNEVIKKYMDATYGDVEMAVDEDGYIHFFSRKDLPTEILMEHYGLIILFLKRCVFYLEIR